MYTKLNKIREHDPCADGIEREIRRSNWRAFPAGVILATADEAWDAARTAARAAARKRERERDAARERERAAAWDAQKAELRRICAALEGRGDE